MYKIIPAVTLVLLRITEHNMRMVEPSCDVHCYSYAEEWQQ